MKLNELKRLAKLKHLSDFSKEELICSFGLYDKALIDLSGIRFANCNNQIFEATALVSKDVEMLNRFLLDETPIMLPCPECGNKMAFATEEWFNPITNLAKHDKNQYKEVPEGVRVRAVNTSSRKMNVFNQAEPYFYLGTDSLAGIPHESINVTSDRNVYEQYAQKCIDACKSTILSEASEIRRDYICSFRNNHRVFVDYRVFDPISMEDLTEIEKLKNADERKEIGSVIIQLKKCLVIQKVGQYPSLADLQLFDIAKYRKILRGDFKDFTRAIGLYADGIGCGSFVYLRRILELLVEEEHQKCICIEGWDEQGYKMAKFVDKMNILEEHGHRVIPAEIASSRKKIYGVLSKGVHESSEEECLELFPYMKFAIEEIMDARIQRIEREEKRLEFQKKLAEQIPE